jgi:hypothetical protein
MFFDGRGELGGSVAPLLETLMHTEGVWSSFFIGEMAQFEAIEHFI